MNANKGSLFVCHIACEEIFNDCGCTQEMNEIAGMGAHRPHCLTCPRLRLLAFIRVHLRLPLFFPSVRSSVASKRLLLLGRLSRKLPVSTHFSHTNHQKPNRAGTFNGRPMLDIQRSLPCSRDEAAVRFVPIEDSKVRTSAL